VDLVRLADDRIAQRLCAAGDDFRDRRDGLHVDSPPDRSHFAASGLAPLGVFLLFLGNCWQAYAKLILRRSFGIAPANRGIKITGPYRLMRHPMYAGYLAVHLGVLAVMFSWWNLAIYAIGWAAQIKRLMAEERLLGEDADYRDYMAKVRWRLIPGVF
jgi:protein-S-isoprenylcysteine O-methyltransferase Ste14